MAISRESLSYLLIHEYALSPLCPDQKCVYGDEKKKKQFVQDHSLMPELGVPFSTF